MLTSHKLQNLRAGPVIKAGMVKDGTVRAWRMNNGFILGRATGEGKDRRYDLADAARLTLMRFLTERLQMPAQAAATTTNAAFSQIALLAMHECHAIDYPARPIPADRYVMVLDRVDGMHPPEIFLREQLDQIERERLLEVRIDLNGIVEYARDNLVNAIGESSLDLRERLREAQAGPAEAAA